MEKNKLYFIIILLLFYLISCSKNNVEKGNFYSKVHTDVSFEASKSKAIDSIYYYIAKETSSIINRTDFNIVAVSLKDNNLIDFDNKDIANIKEYKKDDNFYVEIKVKDSDVYNRTLAILQKLKKEGSVEDKFFRANASIQMPDAGNLSGGQCQRLAIARALLHDSAVYIFDEASSNIDADSETIIMHNIGLLARTKMVILISHRLLNVVNAENIYVMEEGRVVERGTHHALLQQGGVYATLWSKQQELEQYAGGEA